MDFPAYQRVMLTSYQLRLIREFFQDYPNLLYRETLIHGFDPVKNIEHYIWEELFKETFHNGLREKFIRFGRLSDLDISIWMHEEYREYPPENTISLNDEKKRILSQFFQEHPDILKREINIHFFNPYDDLEKYFYQELYNEPYHEDIRRKYDYQGEITDDDLIKWMRQEISERKRHSYQFY